MKNTKRLYTLTMSYYSIITSCNRFAPAGLFITKTLNAQILKLKSWMKKIDQTVTFEIEDFDDEKIKSSRCSFGNEYPIHYIKVD
jgi:hypothetical protein